MLRGLSAAEAHVAGGPGWAVGKEVPPTPGVCYTGRGGCGLISGGALDPHGQSVKVKEIKDLFDPDLGCKWMNALVQWFVEDSCVLLYYFHLNVPVSVTAVWRKRLEVLCVVFIRKTHSD